MTATLELPIRRRTPLPTAGVVAAGATLLVVRPLLAGDGHPTATLVCIFVALLVVGASWPLPSRGDAIGDPVPVAPLFALALGASAFGLGRVLGGGHPPAPFSTHVVALNTLAAVAEEAFFRRLAFALVRAEGAALAVVGSALLFAVVHVTVYGWWVFPIDMAAGLILGWQRLATRRWWVPALTHVIANVLVVL